MEDHIETLLSSIFTPLECAVIIVALGLYCKYGFTQVKNWIAREMNKPENKFKRYNYTGCIDISPAVLKLTRACLYIAAPLIAINSLALIVFLIKGDMSGADNIVEVSNYFMNFAAVLLGFAICLTLKQKHMRA